MQELLLKRKHLFFLHFFTNYCESQRTHMIIFCGSHAQISAQKTRFAPKISSDIRSAAGELFTGPSQSLPEMSDGPTAIGEHWSLDKGADKIVVNGGKWVNPYLQQTTFELWHEISNNVAFWQ